MKRALLLLGILIPASAFANAAMGLGLEMWAVPYWAAYVVAMVIGEAWLIGRWLGLSWPASLALSAVANFITGAGCGMMGCPFLHYPMVGTREDPSPFLNSVALLALFAIPSALLEALVWTRFRGEKSDRALWGRSVVVHLALVPVGLAILLIPPRPYVGLEAVTFGHRRLNGLTVLRALEGYSREKGKLPSARTLDELQNELQPLGLTREDVYGEKKTIQVRQVFRDPTFGRFDLGSAGGSEWEINPDLVGRKLDLEATKETWAWYLRSRDPQSKQAAVVVELSTATFTFRMMSELNR